MIPALSLEAVKGIDILCQQVLGQDEERSVSWTFKFLKNVHFVVDEWTKKIEDHLHLLGVVVSLKETHDKLVL